MWEQWLHMKPTFAWLFLTKESWKTPRLQRLVALSCQIKPWSLKQKFWLIILFTNVFIMCDLENNMLVNLAVFCKEQLLWISLVRPGEFRVLRALHVLRRTPAPASTNHLTLRTAPWGGGSYPPVHIQGTVHHPHCSLKSGTRASDAILLLLSCGAFCLGFCFCFMVGSSQPWCASLPLK